MIGLFFVRKSSARLRVRIHIRQIRLDIVNWCLVHHIYSWYKQAHSVLFMRNDSFQLYTRQSDWIRAVRRTTGEYSDSFISSKSRRPHGRFPCTGFLSYFRKSPQKPQVRVFFNSSQSVRLAKLRFKYNKSSRIGKPTLPWNSKFSRKICVNSCDYFYLF